VLFTLEVPRSGRWSAWVRRGATFLSGPLIRPVEGNAAN
jgi:hypothetical protein